MLIMFKGTVNMPTTVDKPMTISDIYESRGDMLGISDDGEKTIHITDVSSTYRQVKKWPRNRTLVEIVPFLNGSSHGPKSIQNT